MRLYDTATGGAWRLRKDVTTRMTRWTITDTALSPDQRLLVYASISPTAFLVSVGHAGDLVRQLAACVRPRRAVMLTRHAQRAVALGSTASRLAAC